MHKKLGGDTAGTADPHQPKRYSIPYDIVLSNARLGDKERAEDVQSYSVCLHK